ncbi:alpha/beta fold hydrolase [Yoonia litorea]|uniref:Pimeloyl-ACP methyl ester carboxylesterase n=1 Tax=Yoonia litorea TaxID=1123755 RepID=A0A1I6M5R2_9RHOB|nr:alpha/beta hydrolase [Yoonia litorea]SFS10973.1 Pimeloyl-ACP methyl ester carboxylesterase [Yoonia litorea]
MALKALTYTAIAIGIGAALTAAVAGYRASAAEQEYPALGKTVEVDGVPVHYVQEGSGPHVVLLHGAGGNVRDFTFDLMGRLTDRYTVTAFDRPGLGYTGRVPEVPKGLLETAGDAPINQAKLLRDAAEAIGITDPILVGHSFGGIVSLAWAIAALDSESPANPAAIVSLAGVAMPWPGDLGAYYTVNGSLIGGATTIPIISAYTPQSIVEDRIEGTFAPQTAPEGYGHYIGAGLTLRPESMRANIRQVNTLRPHVVEMEKRYPELTLPIEIIHGLEDTTVPIEIHSERIAEIIPQVNLIRLEGVGHMPHHADPAETIAAIDRAAERAAIN